jgi:hypothetical protein
MRTRHTRGSNIRVLLACIWLEHKVSEDAAPTKLLSLVYRRWKRFFVSEGGHSPGCFIATLALLDPDPALDTLLPLPFPLLLPSCCVIFLPESALLLIGLALPLGCGGKYSSCRCCTGVRARLCIGLIRMVSGLQLHLWLWLPPVRLL